MKRKLITLSCTIALCLSLTSCGLKSAIMGQESPTTDDSNSAPTAAETGNDVANTDANNSTAETNTKPTTENTTANNTNVPADSTLANSSSVTQNNTSNITPDKSSSQSAPTTKSRNCRVFYFNKVDLKTYCIDTSVKVTDNAFVTALTQQLYNAPKGNKNFFTLSKDYGVSSATLNYETNVLSVVFNENFIKDMELSKEVANGVIQAIVNTYGYNYSVNKVAVYFGNELYTDIDGTKDNGYCSVNYTDVLKLD